MNLSEEDFANNLENKSYDGESNENSLNMLKQAIICISYGYIMQNTQQLFNYKSIRVNIFIRYVKIYSFFIGK